MGRRKTTAEFIKEVTIVHKGEYTYPRTNYTGSHGKVIITCIIHGDFEQIANNHIYGKGCAKCSVNLLAQNKVKKARESFVEKAIAIHGHKHSYEKTIYTKALNKVIITCPIHGDFEQTPNKHLKGDGCKLCGISYYIKSPFVSLEGFIKRAIAIHGHKYSYEKTIYKNRETKVIITCPIHGDFEQTANNHLHKCAYGCRKCGILKILGTYSHKYFENNPAKKDLNAHLYLIKFNNPSQSYYKIGMSININHRTRILKRESKSHLTEIFTIPTTLFKAFMMEQHILSLYTKFKPSIKFGGSTECLTLTEDDIAEIHKYIYEYTRTL